MSIDYDTNQYKLVHAVILGLSSGLGAGIGEAFLNKVPITGRSFVDISFGAALGSVIGGVCGHYLFKIFDYFGKSISYQKFRGVRITIKNRPICPQNEFIYDLVVSSDKPYQLLKTIQDDPIKFIGSHGYPRDYIITNMIVYGSDIPNLDLLYKVANHMQLDTSKCDTDQKLLDLVKNHIKYSPPPILNTGYEAAKLEHSEVGANYLTRVSDE